MAYSYNINWDMMVLSVSVYALSSYGIVESYVTSSMLLHQYYGIATVYKYSGKAQIRIELGPATESASANNVLSVAFSNTPLSE